ncbi:MAG TPA: hypothetical protein VLW84_07850 [Terriglobales bacterium]|nr:hypothetical protein [Terriglobales bacterium]
MRKTNYAKLTGGLIAAWFAFSLTASALHLFNTDPSRPPLALLLSVLVPLTAFFTWYGSSKPFREFVHSLNPRTVTLIHSWRVVGYTFLVLYTYHILPGIFALPAGWGDIAIGATAPFVAFKLANPNHRTSFIVWQLLGMTDLVLAISLGALSRFIVTESASAISTAPMSVLPLSLIPTFGVPLLLILHIISIAQARRWPAQSAGREERVASFAR